MEVLYTGEEILITSSSVVNIRIVHPELAEPILQQLDYTIVQDKTLGLEFSLHELTSVPTREKHSCLKQASTEVVFDSSVFKTAVAYTGLKETFSEGTYEEYREYVANNYVYTLFADEALQYPFPFAFSISLNPGEYFTIPDAYAAVYLEGQKDYTFSNDNLVCKFTVPYASNSTVSIISDYCLRLCLDVLDSNKASLISKVWTNVPIGCYLTTSSENVLMSNDGVVFTKIIKLNSNSLFIKGVLPSDVTYGFNITDVVIKMVTSEAIDEYIF